MIAKKTLAGFTAALLATVTAVQPALAQYGSDDPSYDNRRDDPYYERDYGTPYNDPNNAPYDQYQRDREYNDRQRNEYDAAQAWRDRYLRDDPRYRNQYAAPPPPTYRPQDDPYYRECRQQRQGNQVAGLIIGGLLGAGLGSTIARGPARGSGTAIGAILGGALGANIGGQLNCDDRNYVYRTYYDGFERGVPRREYRWRNTRSGNYGSFYVGDYYPGPRAERCATYSQTIWIRGRPVPAQGHACRQPDGNWVIVD